MKTNNTRSGSSSVKEAEELDSPLISELQSIIRLLVDSEKGFTDAASNIENAEIASLFRSFVGERASMATDLQDVLGDSGNEAPTTGTVVGTLHRTWLDLRSAISGQDSYAILSEAERGEDYIKGEYEKALRMVWGDRIHSILSTQYLQIKTAHDRVRNLRDKFAK